MADSTAKKLWALLDTGDTPEVRRAAALILAEIGDKNPQVSGLLCAALEDSDASVRNQVLISLGKLRIEAALPLLLTRIRQGGPEAEYAAHAAARLGAKGTHALQSLMGIVAPGLRRRIAGALASGGTTSSESAAVEVLLDSDPNVVDASVRSLISEVPTLQPRHRRALTDHVLNLMRNKKASPLSPRSEAALVRLLAALADNRAESVYWSRAAPPHSTELRSAALQALGTLPVPSRRDKFKLILECACERDFRLAAPALMILKTAPVNDRALNDWLPLFNAPDPASRRFAMEKLGHKDHPKVAAALVRQMTHPDRLLRDEALGCLAQTHHGRAALAQTFLAAESPDQAWILARGQAPFAKDYPAALRGKIFLKACTYLEAGDRRADPLLFLVREAEGRAFRDRMAERALALRKKKQYASALNYLKILGRDPACGDPIRFELAACGLKLSEKALEADARAADPSLQQFSALLHRQASDLPAWIAKAKWLQPEDLFYLGFHFVERTKEEKEFGAGVLRLFIKRSPKSKFVKDARNKLRSLGLN